MSLEGWWSQVNAESQEIKILRERLKATEDRLSQLQRYQAIHYTTQLVMQRELANAHAALRRKGKALKILHKRIQEGKP